MWRRGIWGSRGRVKMSCVTCTCTQCTCTHKVPASKRRNNILVAFSIPDSNHFKIANQIKSLLANFVKCILVVKHTLSDTLVLDLVLFKNDSYVLVSDVLSRNYYRFYVIDHLPSSQSDNSYTSTLKVSGLFCFKCIESIRHVVLLINNTSSISIIPQDHLHLITIHHNVFIPKDTFYDKITNLGFTIESYSLVFLFNLDK